ncbi:simple sugar transport system permease protein [Thermocatellispora tengchongensis]|uniref:Simple sugar transport system permease protein n=1 Tax=Thermocatellispora tengchongensis TaxID=1073253 RepID=A0A840P0K2_9ACTN|nr:ABC transporter permease [Thermocatellispora tengchongensis]MBB5130980.1 simple sugar transport system permease protein [Thermocatellispora tengchongensis]
MNDIELILASAVRLMLPLAFAALGEWIAERAGTLNISVEAMMLGGAFTAIMGSTLTGSPSAGLAFGVATGLLVAFIHATFSHRLTVNTYVVGLTLNVLVLGLTSYLFTRTPGAQVDKLTIPVLSDLPIVGPALFDQRWPAYLLVLLIPAGWWLVHRSRWGLEARAAGENPQSADVTGIDVNKRRRQALLICGALAGLGGAYLSVAEVGSFNTNMTAGRGYIVIAAVIFGGWTLRGTLAGCALFGAADAMRLALPALGYALNPQLLIATPYLLALLAMTFFAKRNRGPGALGQPFVRGIT